MDSVTEQEARDLLAAKHICEDADPEDWEVLERPFGAYTFEQGLVTESGSNSGLVVQLNFYRSPETNLITVKMSVFRQVRKQPKVRIYQLHITTKSYDPDNWHEEAHEHFGSGRAPVPQWRSWRSFEDVLRFFCKQTNIEFRPELDDPEQLRLKP
ncbi:hypothetical protein [Comamonas terrigena]|uniref:hypothetical protein n=1 Tax=Comamonas terrigena TaxID=32013 RepID=UPI0023535113|nr:hypothetical protein [Comamonas terrigena]